MGYLIRRRGLGAIAETTEWDGTPITGSGGGTRPRTPVVVVDPVPLDPVETDPTLPPDAELPDDRPHYPPPVTSGPRTCPPLVITGYPVGFIFQQRRPSDCGMAYYIVTTTGAVEISQQQAVTYGVTNDAPAGRGTELLARDPVLAARNPAVTTKGPGLGAMLLLAAVGVGAVLVIKRMKKRSPVKNPGRPGSARARLEAARRRRTCRDCGKAFVPADSGWYWRHSVWCPACRKSRNTSYR